MPNNTKQLYRVTYNEPYQPISHFCGVFDSKELAQEYIYQKCREDDNDPKYYHICLLEINEWV